MDRHPRGPRAAARAAAPAGPRHHPGRADRPRPGRHHRPARRVHRRVRAAHPGEQNALVAGFGRWLHALDGPPRSSSAPAASTFVLADRLHEGRLAWPTQGWKSGPPPRRVPRRPRRPPRAAAPAGHRRRPRPRSPAAALHRPPKPSARSPACEVTATVLDADQHRRRPRRLLPARPGRRPDMKPTAAAGRPRKTIEQRHRGRDGGRTRSRSTPGPCGSATTTPPPSP